MSSEWDPPSSVFELHQFVDLMLNGEFTLDPPFLDLMCNSLAKIENLQELKDTEDNKKRVEFVSGVFPCIKFRNILNSIDKVLTKNKAIFGILKSRAESSSELEDKEKALRCCTLAISFAPTQAASLAGAFLARAGILVEMKKLELAQVDFKNAESVVPDEPQLYMDNSLGRNEGSESLQGQIIPQGLNYLPTVTSLPDFVSVELDPNKGRYLVANRDLEAGTIVFVEEAYVSAPVNQLNWQVKHCARCLKETSNPIPCDGCVFCIYCGVECRSEHQKEGHEYECPILPYVHSYKMPRILHLCLKSICKIGPKVLKILYVKSKFEERIEDTWIVPASSTHGNYDRYSQVLNMARHNRSFEMPFSVWYAVSLAYALRIKTTFFDNIERTEMLAFENFIATVIMYHSESFPFNTMALNAIGIEILNAQTYYDSRSYPLFPQVGSGVFPMANLMNHSCAATTFRQHLAGCRLAIITNIPLKAGEELSHNYGHDFIYDPLEQRQKDLFEYFHILCDCVACTEDWPMYKDINPPCIFVCPPCRANIQGLIAKSPISEIPVRKFKSKRCTSKKEPNPTSAEMCNPFSYILDLTHELLLQNKPHQALSLLKECIKHFQNDPCQPSVQLIMAQTRLMDSFNMILGKVIITEEPEVVKTEQAKKEWKICCIM